MPEGLVCFNCGRPTDYVGADGEAICRDCHNARKGVAPAEEVSSDYEELTAEELRDILRDRDLPVNGRKSELVARLQDDDAAGEE